MDKIRQLAKNVSLKKSFILYVSAFAIFALLLSVATAALSQQAVHTIYDAYPPSGEKYYLTNENGERFGEGTYLSNEPTPLSQADQQWVTFLEFVQLVATPFYSALCIIAAAWLFYRNKLSEPLAKLRWASDNISNNILDFQLDYPSQDELGQLCQSFEFMRLTLANNFSEMWRQMEDRKQLNAAFAHDLRTPLTVLKGYDEILQASSDPFTQETALTMAKHIGILEKYVESMSRLQRLEDVQAQGEQFAVNAYVTRLAESAEILCEQTGRTLSVKANLQKLPLVLDASFISQVHNNLLANALRYSKKDVQLEYVSDEDGFYLAVVDDGPGFSETILPEATKPYVTVEKNHSDHFGLGLSICQTLCERHGGYLIIENGPTGAKVSAFFSTLAM